MKHTYVKRILLLFTLLITLSLGSVHAQTTTDDIPTIDTVIRLDSDSISVDGEGVTVNRSVVTIHSAGTYSLSGALADGQILVDTADSGLVTLVLDGVNLNSTTSAPIYIKKADRAAILLADGTENFVTDATVYIYDNDGDNEPNAAVFSDDDLLIYGTGSLTVTANFNDGIASKDSLTIVDAVLNVTAADDGIRGKDFLRIDGAYITVEAVGDGLKSDNEDDPERGYILIERGVLTIKAGGDGMQAETTLTIHDGMFDIAAGGGSRAYLADDASAKGLKARVGIIINGGDFTINAADDAIHSDDYIVINGGAFTLATGDDAIHADLSIEINSGDINITESYEGIESMLITINDGNIAIVASDDGINAADGTGAVAVVGGQMPGGQAPAGQMPGGQAPRGQMRGPGGFGAVSEAHRIIINGGYIVMNTGGDGLDANGYIEMHGGRVIITGASATSPDSAIDYDGGFTMTGGFLLGVGSSQMMQAPDNASSQYAFAVGLTSTQPAGTVLDIRNSAGESLATFTSTKPYQAVVFSAPELVGGETYTLYLDDTAYTSLTLTDIITQIGGGGFRGRGGRP